MKKIIAILITLVSFLNLSCTSTKSTIKNIDYKAVKPSIVNKTFVLTEYANDAKYGYDKNYPINIGIANSNSENFFISAFFAGLTDEFGKAVSFEKTDTCCPFPSKHNNMGVGLLFKYKVTKSNGEIKELYFNIYEKGAVLCPNGFKIKSNDK